MIARLYAHLGRLFDLLAVAAGLLILFMVLVVSLDVGARAIVARFGLVWSNDVSEYGIYLVTLLVAPRLLRYGQHVKIDIFSSRVPGAAGRALARLVDVIGLAVCLIIAVYATRMAWRSYIEGAMINKNLVFPEWIALAPLPITFWLLASEFAFGFLVNRERAEQVLT